MTENEYYTLFREIKDNNPNLVLHLLGKASRESESERQNLYGDLHDWLRDQYGTQYDLSVREELVRRIIADYVIHNPECFTKTYIVVQESNVDGNVVSDIIPCVSMNVAKRVMREKKNSLLHVFGHFKDCDINEMEVEEGEERYFIQDPVDDYYELLYIQTSQVTY
jgi:uncharacterized protein YbgA (DUF1722 family)